LKIGVFFAWSGELSCKLAEAISNWLPKALQAVKPFFTPDDLEKGAKWDSEISKELDASQIGLLFLSRDNVEKPWILFEAGALSTKMGNAKVCPILFGFEPAELKGPLATFQLTRFTKDDFKKLISTINNSCGDMKLELKNFEEIFEEWWPKLDEKIKGIMSSHKAEPKKEPRTERDILIEILELTRMLAKPQKPFEIDDQTLREIVLPGALGPEWASRLNAAFHEPLTSWDAMKEKAHREAVKNIVNTSIFPAKKHVSKALKPDEKK
jgi:hypothetical protein